MAKKRLNSHHRALLCSFAEENVKCEEEHALQISTYNAACVRVREIVERKYPPTDMKLLDKYGVATNDRCIRGVRMSGSDSVIGFEFATDEEAPLFPSCGGCSNRVLTFDDATVECILEANRADEAYKNAVKTKITAYRALIFDSRYFEDVVEVWPALEALRAEIGASSTALSRLSPSLAEFIRNDNAGAIAA